MLTGLGRRFGWAAVAALLSGCGGPAARPAPAVLASILRPSTIALRDSRVYVAQEAETPGASVWSIAALGGDAKSFASCACTGLAVDERFVFWSGRAIGRAPLLLESPAVTFTGRDFTEAQSADIVSDGARIFWADATHSEIRSATVDGADVRIVAAEQNQAGSLVVDATYLYWANFESNGRINRTPREGTVAPVEALVSDVPSPHSLVVTATHVYWADGQYLEGRIMRTPLAGGPAETLASSYVPGGLAVDDKYVYWGSRARVDAVVQRVPLAGGAVTVVADQQGQPLSLAVDATHLYWVNFTGGTVVRIAKSDMP